MAKTLKSKLLAALELSFDLWVDWNWLYVVFLEQGNGTVEGESVTQFPFKQPSEIKLLNCASSFVVWFRTRVWAFLSKASSTYLSVFSVGIWVIWLRWLFFEKGTYFWICVMLLRNRYLWIVTNFILTAILNNCSWLSSNNKLVWKENWNFYLGSWWTTLFFSFITLQFFFLLLLLYKDVRERLLHRRRQGFKKRIWQSNIEHHNMSQQKKT